MSTPRCPAKLNGNPPPTCRLERGHTGDHESLQPHGILSWAKGVAAPLEPSAQEFAKAYVQQLNAKARKGTQYFIGENDIKLMEAYAAAVSKNLQEELAQLKPHDVDDGFGSVWPPCKKHHCSMDVMRPGDARCPQCENEDYVDRLIERANRLEKEIAALRETK